MSTTARPHLLVCLSCVCVLALAACGKSGTTGKSSQRKVTVKIGGATAPGSVTANVAQFDPNADISLDMDKFGSERPDQYEIQQAFFGQFGALDECVWAEKDRRGDEAQLLGDVSMAVKLNPETSRPFGVNATMPEAHAKSTELQDCLREAAASAPYPTYDGPPVIVDFEFELDPGFVESD
ncbi:hypothetical protein [Enhygromyxa salina]|uniref:hypothetical protein n=1 Tax=Enhygromyxa salina TaxID=215803 RepID=UPI0006974ADB|nr:hypothetical protein [Enhygromyxa salina]